MHLFRVGALLSASALLVTGCGDSELVDGEPLGTNTAALSTWGVKVLGPGFSPSLAIDVNGVPAVSVGQGVADPSRNRGDTTPVVYMNSGGWRHEGGWRAEYVGVLPNQLEASHHSLAFNDTTAQLLFSSRDTSNRNNPMTLKLATKSGPGWQVSNFADDGWIRQAVQRVSDRTTRVVYPDPTRTDHVRIATSGFGGWTTQTLPMPLATLNSLDFAVGDSGKPVLGIVTTTLGSGGGVGAGVHFVGSADDGATWGPVVTIDDAWAMIGPQIAFSGDVPMVTYTELDAHHAKFAYSEDGGLSWIVETIATFDVNPVTGVAVDPTTGEPVVVIGAKDLTANEDRLHIARRDYKGNWTLEIVDSVDLFTGYRFAVDPRIAITDDGTVVVAYETYNNLGDSHIRFAWDDPQPIVVTPPGR